MNEEIMSLYEETFKTLPPLPFGKMPNKEYYELLFKAIKRDKPVTPQELEEVFDIEDSNYDLLEQFDEDYEDDIAD